MKTKRPEMTTMAYRRTVEGESPLSIKSQLAEVAAARRVQGFCFRHRMTTANSGRTLHGTTLLPVPCFYLIHATSHRAHCSLAIQRFFSTHRATLRLPNGTVKYKRRTNGEQETSQDGVIVLRRCRVANHTLTRTSTPSNARLLYGLVSPFDVSPCRLS